ncbi:MAG: Crp/Fnr family transcriptional regulator [Burkholderiales bacterium]
MGMSALPQSLPRFEGLGEKELRALLERAAQRTVPRNTILVAEGDETDAVFFVLAGRVKIFLSDAGGKEVVINIQGPGEYFGEMSLEPGGRSASVMTLEPSRLAVVKMPDFRSFLLGHPEFQQELVRKLIRRVRGLTGHVRDLALLDVYGRVVRTLESLACEHEGRMIVPQIMSQQAIANLVGASREMVSRILKDLRVGGYIGLEERRIVMLRKPPPAW